MSLIFCDGPSPFVPIFAIFVISCKGRLRRRFLPRQDYGGQGELRGTFNLAPTDRRSPLVPFRVIRVIRGQPDRGLE